MKIACQSCQAKYTIADEKVVGKVVKIRCKKCGTTIVVNGQEGAGVEKDEATEIRSSSADLGLGAGAAATTTSDAEGWTVNVAENDQRTMSTQQIAASFASGEITDETYCWKDGMGDWLPLREIEELSAACGLSAGSAFAQQPAPQVAAARASTRPAANEGGGLAGIFGSGASGGAAAASAGTAAARRGGRGAGADLFGAAAEAGGENDVMTSAPTNAQGGLRGDDSKMKGERNENSVLFSLNALTANDPKKAAAGKPLGAAEGDGSGLIDIRALSSAMASTGAPKKTNHADDIMNLGGGGAFSAALAAPVLTAPPLDSGDATPQAAASNKKMMMMFAALAALLVIGMVGMYIALKPAPVQVAANGTGEPTGPAAASAGSPAAAAPSSATGATPPAAATPDPGATAVAGNDTHAAAPNVGATTGHGKGPAAATPRAVDNTPALPAPPPPAPAAPQSLEQQMAHSVPAAAAAAAPAAPAAGSAPFDRGAAAAALSSIAESVGSCKKPGGPTGDGHVSITFSPSGGVVSAIVDQPPFAGTAVGGCVAGKFRGAHVPPFAGGNMPVGKRFSIN